MLADRAAAAPVLVLALSARWMAEALARVGHCVLACDLFGDADTRAVAHAWARAGDSALLALDVAQCRTSLQDLVSASPQPPLGWLAGPGCESVLAELQPFMDELGVPLIGNDAATVDAVRDPQRFFAALDAHGLAHPPVSWDGVAPTAQLGDRPAEIWLSKDAWGSGGWHVAFNAGATSDGGKAALQRTPVSHAGGAWVPEETAVSPVRPQAPERRYWQRCEAGQPVSLLFLADGHEVVPLAWQRQVVAAHGISPFAWQGVQGPLQLAPTLLTEGLRAAQILTRTFGLRGLNSLDGLWVAADASDPVCDPAVPSNCPVSTGLASRAASKGTAIGTLRWLELNPRCSASMALYPDWPLMRWHLQACAARMLPDGLAEARAVLGRAASAQAGPLQWRGTQIVWADRDGWLDPEALAAALAQPDCHDLPAEAGRVARGMPLVTVSATATTQAELEAALAASARRACQLLLGVGDSGAYLDSGSGTDTLTRAIADADAVVASGAPPIPFSLEFSA